MAIPLPAPSDGDFQIRPATDTAAKIPPACRTESSPNGPACERII
jgi:hypothetical protein